MTANDKDPHVRTFTDLRKTGLLWLINTSLLHPRGFAMAVVLDTEGEVTGWKLLGDGTEPWTFGDEGDEQFAAVNGLLQPVAADSAIPAGWTGPTAEIHEFEPPHEPIYADANGPMPGACGDHRPGTSTCTRPAGHPRTLHIARNAAGEHQGEWDAN